MNCLTADERITLVAALVAGGNIRFISKTTGIARNTVAKLLVDVGTACMQYHDKHVRNIRVRRLHCHEVQSYVGARAKNVTHEKKEICWGDLRTWTGIDADTKLVVSYLVGGYGADWAMDFIKDTASRINGRVQLKTDGCNAYLDVAEDGVSTEVDYGQLHKIYGASLETETRYLSATSIGCDMRTISGDPDSEPASTSYVEGQNLTMKTQTRRFRRLTNAFSKRIENHAYAVAFHFMYFNFVRIHQTLRATPAMVSGLSNQPWDLNKLVELTFKPSHHRNSPE